MPGITRFQRFAIGTLLGSASALGLSGCGQDMADLKRYAEDVKQRPAGPIEPLPQIRPYEGFSYTVHSQRDPFSPLAVETPQQTITAGPQPDLNRRKELLESFPLDSIRMQGILEKDGQLWGLVRSPDGIIHQVRKGNYMGQNYGRITAIKETRIELTELIPDGQGGWMERDVSIALSE